MMRTHFLEGNNSATMEEIMGTYVEKEVEDDSSRSSTPEKTDKTKTPPDTPPGRYNTRPSNVLFILDFCCSSVYVDSLEYDSTQLAFCSKDTTGHTA